MPIVHQWLIPQRIFFVRWSGLITLEDLQESNRNTANFLQTGIAPVHLIRDDSATTEMAAFSIRQVVETLNATRNPNLGWIITIGYSNPIAYKFAELYAKFSRIRMQRQSNLDDALNFLKQSDPSLDFSQMSEDFERS